MMGWGFGCGGGDGDGDVDGWFCVLRRGGNGEVWEEESVWKVVGRSMDGVSYGVVATMPVVREQWLFGRLV